MAKMYDKLLGWYSVLPRNDQIAIYRWCQQNGYPTLAGYLGDLWREGVIFKDWLTTIPGGVRSVFADIGRTAAKKGASDAQFLSQQGKAFVERLQELKDASGNAIEGVKDGMRPKGFGGLPIQTQFALRKLYKDMGWELPD